MAHGSSLVFLHYLTTVFDNIADGIMLIDVEGEGEGEKAFRLLLANKSFFDFSGYPADSLGKLVSEIVDAEGFVFLSRQYKKVIQSKQPLTYLHWSDVPAGMRAFDVRLVPVLNTTGDCVQIAAIVRDVTEFEQLRTEVERLRETVRGIHKSIS